ncbi:MAG TPA: NADPH-dependent FMN reductase, partial [Lactobacillus sp.]|nr:NADPH-dependent FMN reductase [Lactobacillus sp.]
LKMPVLSVAPMITLSPSASQSEALNTLVAYEPLLPALEAEFKRYLN